MDGGLRPPKVATANTIRLGLRTMLPGDRRDRAGWFQHELHLAIGMLYRFTHIAMANGDIPAACYRIVRCMAGFRPASSTISRKRLAHAAQLNCSA